jgi:predicted RNA-binding protein with RPS1 domain
VFDIFFGECDLPILQRVLQHHLQLVKVDGAVLVQVVDIERDWKTQKMLRKKSANESCDKRHDQISNPDQINTTDFWLHAKE